MWPWCCDGLIDQGNIPGPEHTRLELRAQCALWVFVSRALA